MTRSEDALETATSDASAGRSKARSAEIDGVDQDPSRFHILTVTVPTGPPAPGPLLRHPAQPHVLLQNREI